MLHKTKSGISESLTFKGQRLQAKAKVNGKWYWLGFFRTPAEAAKAFQSFKKLTGECGPAMAAMRYQASKPKHRPSDNFNRKGGNQ